MIASMLTDQTMILDNVPRLADVGLLQRRRVLLEEPHRFGGGRFGGAPQFAGRFTGPAAALVWCHAAEPTLHIGLVACEQQPLELLFNLRLRVVTGGGQGVERLDLVCREIERVSGAGGEIAIRLCRPARLEHEAREVGGGSWAANLNRGLELRVCLQVHHRRERLQHLCRWLLDEKREAHAQLTI